MVPGVEADHMVLRFDQSRVLDVASAPSSPQKALFKSLPSHCMRVLSLGPMHEPSLPVRSCPILDSEKVGRVGLMSAIKWRFCDVMHSCSARAKRTLLFSAKSAHTLAHFIMWTHFTADFVHKIWNVTRFLLSFHVVYEPHCISEFLIWALLAISWQSLVFWNWILSN